MPKIYGYTEVLGDLTIMGSFSVIVSGMTSSFQIANGTEGIGKVLTSDAFGNASWQTSSGSVIATNGLTQSSGVIMLGGTLSTDTTIEVGSNEFFIQSTPDTNIFVTTGIIDISSNNGTYLSEVISESYYASVRTREILSGSVSSIEINSIPTAIPNNGNNSIILQDQLLNKGIVYFDDYSANFTPESLVSKRYVDAKKYETLIDKNFNLIAATSTGEIKLYQTLHLPANLDIQQNDILSIKTQFETISSTNNGDTIILIYVSDSNIFDPDNQQLIYQYEVPINQPYSIVDFDTQIIDDSTGQPFNGSDFNPFTVTSFTNNGCYFFIAGAITSNLDVLRSRLSTIKLER